MPYDSSEGILVNDNGEFRLTGLARTYRSINIMVTSVPGQSIIVAGKEYSLHRFAGPGSAITLRIRRPGFLRVSK